MKRYNSEKQEVHRVSVKQYNSEKPEVNRAVVLKYQSQNPEVRRDKQKERYGMQYFIQSLSVNTVCISMSEDLGNILYRIRRWWDSHPTLDSQMLKIRHHLTAPPSPGL